MRETHNRISFFDTYKGLLMILVVIGHFSFFEYEDKIITLIYSFHMPAFLIIYGILSKHRENDTILSIIKRRFISCIVPYFIFYFITYVIIPKVDTIQYSISLKSTLSGVADLNYSMNLPLWFLTFYFSNTTIFELLQLLSTQITINKTKSTDINDKKFIVTKEILLFSFCIIVTILAFIYSRVYKLGRIVYNFEIAMFCMMFTYIGHLIKVLSIKIKNKISTSDKNKIIFVVLNIFTFIIITIIWYKLSLYNKRIDLNARNFRHSHILYINAILGFYIFSIISFILNKIYIIKNILSYIGKNSIYILAYHIPSVFYMNILFNDFLPTNLLPYLNSLNIFSFIYKLTTAILFSLFMALIHKGVKQYINKQ